MNKLSFALLVLGTILNSIAIAITVFTLRFSRFEFKWRTTFWMKRKYGFEVILWEKAIEGCSTGYSIFRMNFFPKRLAEKDDYKKHCAQQEEKRA